MKHLLSLMVSLFFVFGIVVVNAEADVNINIGINAPPITFAAAPDVVVVPSGSSYVYMTPDTPGIYFYDGYWYRFYGDHWFRATIYSGPWGYVSTSLVPIVVLDIPPYYVHYLPRGYHRIHYRDLDRHWRTWHRDRHWNKYNWYKQEVRERERHRREGYKPSHGEGYKPPQGEGYRPPRGEGYKPSQGGGHPPKEGYRPPKGGERGPAVKGRGVQPATPYKALEEKGHKPKSEGRKQKGEHEKKGKKGEHNEER
jgi:hypothetical protein